MDDGFSPVTRQIANRMTCCFSRRLFLQACFIAPQLLFSFFGDLCPRISSPKGVEEGIVAFDLEVLPA